MLKQLYYFLSPKFQNLFLDYKVVFKPRYGHGKPPHPELNVIINEERNEYSRILNRALSYKDQFISIKQAKVCFLEILPRLKKGVIVHIHDSYWPNDYPQFMCDRFYSEQYGLGLMIMGNPQRYKTILPNYFISEDPELKKILNPIWQNPSLQNVEQHGWSYWLRIG